MKRLTWWMAPLVAALVLGLAVADVAQAAKAEDGKARGKDREKGGKKGGGVRGEYAILAKECDLTAEQREQVRAKIQANKAAIAEWQQQNGEKAKELQKAMKAARDAGNKEEMKRVGEQLKTLSAERRTLQSQTMTDVMSVLTGAQKAQWNAFRLYRIMMMRYKKAGLTEEQTAKIREMADQVGAGLDANDENAYRSAAKDLAGKVAQSVLTEDQRRGLGKKGGKDRPEKGGKKGRKKGDEQA